jgi:hypothetical protein
METSSTNNITREVEITGALKFENCNGREKNYEFMSNFFYQRNSFLRGFPLPFNVETLQAFGALFQIPHYYRKFLYYKTKMLCTYLS